MSFWQHLIYVLLITGNLGLAFVNFHRAGSFTGTFSLLASAANVAVAIFCAVIYFKLWKIYRHDENLKWDGR